MAGKPNLLMTGTLIVGEPVEFRLIRAAADAPAYLVLGLSLLQAPFKDGTMVPDTDLIVPFVTDGQGQIVFQVPWPDAIPSGTPSWYQFWIEDAAAPKGLSASNGLQGTTP